MAAVAAVLAAVAPGAASPRTCGSGAHGAPGYGYAGHQAAGVAHGIRATITPLARAGVSAGHVAGWVGVGGPRQGRDGETVWLQAGVASLPGRAAMVYAEITRAGEDPVFVPVRENVATGESHTVAVLEMAGRPNVWRVWVDGKPVTGPLLLPGSTGRWRPIATAESWNGGTTACNSFAFRFDGVGVATAGGGGWRAFVPGFTFRDRGFAVRGLAPVAERQRSPSAGTVAPYAFEASSR